MKKTPYSLAKIPPGVGPRQSQVVVLVGATGDLSRRKLLPGLFYLSSAGFIPSCRIIGVSLDQIDADGLRKIAREALDQFSSRTVKDADWAVFAETGAEAACKGCGYVEGSQVLWDRDWHGATYRKRAVEKKQAVWRHNGLAAS